MDQTALAASRFGAAATGYLASAVHAHGADLIRLTEVTHALNTRAALDVGCGAGHASFAMASAGAHVIAYDISDDMLAVVTKEGAGRGLTAIETRRGPAEKLPFGDAAFDLVATRFSAHHWRDVPSALAEIRRVLKAGGTLIVIDAVAPEDPLFGTVLQTVELLRDASHVCDYRISEWIQMFRGAGFTLPLHDRWTLRMEFDTWIARMHTPEQRVCAIRDVFEHTPEEVQRHFSIGDDDSFDLGVAWLESR